MHHIAVCSTNANEAGSMILEKMILKNKQLKDVCLRGDLTCPQGEAVCIDVAKLLADGSNMMNQPEIFL
jgi:hypothetical protein